MLFGIGYYSRSGIQIYRCSTGAICKSP